MVTPNSHCAIAAPTRVFGRHVQSAPTRQWGRLGWLPHMLRGAIYPRSNPRSAQFGQMRHYQRRTGDYSDSSCFVRSSFCCPIYQIGKEQHCLGVGGELPARARAAVYLSLINRWRSLMRPNTKRQQTDGFSLSPPPLSLSLSLTCSLK